MGFRVFGQSGRENNLSFHLLSFSFVFARGPKGQKIRLPIGGKNKEVSPSMTQEQY